MDTCSIIRDSIIQQQTFSQILDNQIDSSQEKIIGVLKNLILEKHLFIHRLFISESYHIGNLTNPLSQSVFQTKKINVSENFAALILPSDFTKGPMKAFLNTLLDSLESFLPAFYKLNPIKIPRGSFPTDPSTILVRCVFPSLFGYCWAEESALSYASNLAKWFEELTKNSVTFPNDFENHWMFQAFRGFFTSIDFQPFISFAIRPVFFNFIQIDGTLQNNDQILVNFAISALDSIIKHFEKVPRAVGFLFSSLFEVIDRNENIEDKLKTKTFIFRQLFFDGIIKPFFDYPVLYNVCDLPILKSDYNFFSSIYNVFRAKLFEEANLFQSCNGYNEFSPFSIINLFFEGIPSMVLPSLKDFCTVVQCAHQPLLMTTLNLSLLFRFVASLQHTSLLPSSIDKSISTVFQQALTDQLERLPDNFFWFPCFSLRYLNITSTCFYPTRNRSSMYRLLSSPYIKIPQKEVNFKNALKVSLQSCSIISHPDLRTQIQWIIDHDPDSNEIYTSLKQEIHAIDDEMKIKESRHCSLNSLIHFLLISIDSIPTYSPIMSLGDKLYESDESLNKFNSIQSSENFNKSLEIIRLKYKSSYDLIGPFMVSKLLLINSPSIKSQPPYKLAPIENVALNSLIRAPLMTSSILPQSIQLSQDCHAIIQYGLQEKINSPLKICFQNSTDYEALSRSIDEFILCNSTSVLSSVFSEEEIESLRSFVSVFYKV